MWYIIILLLLWFVLHILLCNITDLFFMHDALIPQRFSKSLTVIPVLPPQASISCRHAHRCCDCRLCSSTSFLSGKYGPWAFGLDQAGMTWSNWSIWSNWKRTSILICVVEDGAFMIFHAFACMTPVWDPYLLWGRAGTHVLLVWAALPGIEPQLPGSFCSPCVQSFGIWWNV